MGPATTNVLASKKYLLIHLFIIYLSSILPMYLITVHFEVYEEWGRITFFLTLPFYLFLWYGCWVLMAIGIAAIFLQIIKWIHPPKEGYFRRDSKDKDYKYWSLRATIKKFPIWLSHNFWVPWLDLLAYKLFGMKINGKTALFDAWVDTEFLEIGKNVTIGQGAIVMGTMLTRDWLIIKKTVLKDNVVVGGYSVVSPGTLIEENAIIGAASHTMVGQRLESGWVYLGSPAKKFKENKARFNTEL